MDSAGGEEASADTVVLDTEVECTVNHRIGRALIKLLHNLKEYGHEKNIICGNIHIVPVCRLCLKKPVSGAGERRKAQY